VFVKGALRRTLAQDSGPDGKRRLRAPGTQLLIRAHLGDQWCRRPARKPRLAPAYRERKGSEIAMKIGVQALDPSVESASCSLDDRGRGPGLA
jgi:hypothetical protein